MNTKEGITQQLKSMVKDDLLNEDLKSIISEVADKLFDVETARNEALRQMNINNGEILAAGKISTRVGKITVYTTSEDAYEMSWVNNNCKAGGIKLIKTVKNNPCYDNYEWICATFLCTRKKEKVSIAIFDTGSIGFAASDKKHCLGDITKKEFVERLKKSRCKSVSGGFNKLFTIASNLLNKISKERETSKENNMSIH